MGFLVYSDGNSIFATSYYLELWILCWGIIQIGQNVFVEMLLVYIY